MLSWWKPFRLSWIYDIFNLLCSQCHEMRCSCCEQLCLHGWILIMCVGARPTTFQSDSNLLLLIKIRTEIVKTLFTGHVILYNPSIWFRCLSKQIQGVWCFQGHISIFMSFFLLLSPNGKLNAMFIFSFTAVSHLVGQMHLQRIRMLN